MRGVERGHDCFYLSRYENLVVLKVAADHTGPSEPPCFFQANIQASEYLFIQL